MDEFGDIIYFILLILFVFSGLFKKKKKTQESSTHQSDNTQAEETEFEWEHNVGWEEFEEMLKGSQSMDTVVIQKPVQQKTAHTDYEKVRPKNTMKAQTFQKLKPSTFAQNIRKSSLMKEIEQTEEINSGIEFELSEAFSDIEEVKKAFVYSQVFEQKY